MVLQEKLDMINGTRAQGCKGARAQGRNGATVSDITELVLPLSL